MVVQVAPVEKNVGETMCSLMFAERVRAVELGKAAARKETAEIAILKEKLKEYEVHYSNMIDCMNKFIIHLPEWCQGIQSVKYYRSVQ